MKNYLKGWNFMRFLRFALGIFIVIQGIQTQEWLFMAMGGIFVLMPLLNIGCCSSRGCVLPTSKINQNFKDITNEEVS